MSVEVDYLYYDNVWQDSEYQEWWWGVLGAADGRYWSCAVVPEYANVAGLEVTRFWWSSDNTHEFNLTAHFVIRADLRRPSRWRELRLQSDTRACRLTRRLQHETARNARPNRQDCGGRSPRCGCRQAASSWRYGRNCSASAETATPALSSTCRRSTRTSRSPRLAKGSWSILPAISDT